MFLICACILLLAMLVHREWRRAWNQWPTSSEYIKRRSWRKLHIGFDAVTGRIVASILTDRDVDDASQVEPLLDQIAEPIELFLGDGGYDRTNVYTALDERHPDALILLVTSQH